MTLRGALAAALSSAGVNADHSPYTPESVADAILADPALREALTEAVAEAVRSTRDVFTERDLARVIVDRMLEVTT